MTIQEIRSIEENRKPADFGVIHLLKEGNFYRAHDWSAWLMKTFPLTEHQMTLTAKQLKDGYFEVWVGFPCSSISKFVPQVDGIQFLPVDDTRIDVVITLPEDVVSQSYEAVRDLVEQWKQAQPVTENKKQKREEREVVEVAPRIMRISDVMGRVLSFPLESKSPMEAWEFLRQLRQQVAAMF